MDRLSPAFESLITTSTSSPAVMRWIVTARLDAAVSWERSWSAMSSTLSAPASASRWTSRRLGVSSFSHLGGVHFQNEHAFEPYVSRAESGEQPIARAYALSPEEALIREFILQLKAGSVEAGYFREKFGVDVRERFAEQLAEHVRNGHLEVAGDEIRTTGEGLLRVDSLLPPFFLERHQNARYA